MQSDIIKLPRLYWGKILLTDFRGKNSAGEKMYGGLCACGNSVERAASQLTIRKLGQCDVCRAEYVADKAEQKAQDRAKNKRR